MTMGQSKNFGGSKETWQKAVLPLDSTIGDAVQNLNDVGIKIILAVDKANKLIGTIQDGDIRRGLLKGLDLNSPIVDIVRNNPLVVPPELAQEAVLHLMGANKIHQIPVVDEQQQLVGLHLWDEITSVPERTNLMVVMAGGKGVRLLPHTENCPKPMVLVAGKPMLEHIIERGKLEGFNHFVLAIHHLGHIIEDYFGSGDRLGVKIEYLRERSPLGTAGALALLGSMPEKPFVVTNGDVITDIRYGELLDFHNRYQAAATMAVRAHQWQNPFGVVKTKGVEVVGFEEKPVVRSHINAGVYVLSPEALNVIPKDTVLDMPTLFARLRAAKGLTVAYPMHEPWLDVGSPKDLQTINGNFESKKITEPER